MSLFPNIDVLEASFAHWFMGDRFAVEYALTMYRLAQVWDDVLDEAEPPRKAIEEVFETLTMSLPLNPFFAQNARSLIPAQGVLLAKWRAANVFEQAARIAPDREETADEVSKAWMLRAGYYDLWILVALLKGGQEHADAIAPEIWRTYGERLPDFRMEVSADG